MRLKLTLILLLTATSASARPVSDAEYKQHVAGKQRKPDSIRIRQKFPNGSKGKTHVSALAKMPQNKMFDTLITNAQIVDGSGSPAYPGQVGIVGDRIVYVGPVQPQQGGTTVDARGKVVAPGFINMLSWATESLMFDPLAQSDLRQGVTLEVFGEGESLGPLNAVMKADLIKQQADFKYPITWTTLGQALSQYERRGIGPNVASFVGTATVRTHELGQGDVDPTPAQLARMQGLVTAAMKEGALGVGSALIYAPALYAEKPELIALAKSAAQCGGGYISHMRSEGDNIETAVDELIDIARQSGGRAEIYHLKMAGKNNWGKLDAIIGKVEEARAAQLKVSANMYNYTAGATGLDVSMPPWVRDGGPEAWMGRLKDPANRERLIREMSTPQKDWENLYLAAGAENITLLGFKNPKLKPLTGKTLAEVAKMRGTGPEATIIDLIVEDHSRVEMAIFLMDEKNVRRQIQIPWMSFGSDAEASEPKGVFLQMSTHPRAYGNVARLLGRYVRDEKLISLPDAVRKLTSLPATNWGIRDRGLLKAGYFADVVIFDPAIIADHATYEKPQQFATGVTNVFVNGKHVVKDSVPTGVKAGRFVHGPGWTGWPGGGACPITRNPK
jgi:N-acyl-D-amino-acid deacylase